MGEWEKDGRTKIEAQWEYRIKRIRLVDSGHVYSSLCRSDNEKEEIDQDVSKNRLQTKEQTLKHQKKTRAIHRTTKENANAISAVEANLFPHRSCLFPFVAYASRYTICSPSFATFTSPHTTCLFFLPSLPPLLPSRALLLTPFPPLISLVSFLLPSLPPLLPSMAPTFCHLCLPS